VVKIKSAVAAAPGSASTFQASVGQVWVNACWSRFIVVTTLGVTSLGYNNSSRRPPERENMTVAVLTTSALAHIWWTWAARRRA
jgi:hypothetical protein